MAFHLRFGDFGPPHALLLVGLIVIAALVQHGSGKRLDDDAVPLTVTLPDGG